MGRLYIGELRRTEGTLRRTDAPTLATFRDLILRNVAATQPQPGQLRLKMLWSTPTGTPRNWRFSYRLVDADGRLVRQRDRQPGYGYLPTTLWRPGDPVVDHALIDLPEGLAPGAYTLKIITYLLGTTEGGGEAEIPLQLTSPTLYDLRDACCEQTRKGATILCGTEELALLDVHAPQELTAGENLSFTAEWNALLRPTSDITATWTLQDPDGTAIAQTTRPLAPGSRTTSWPRHTWVLAPFELGLPAPLEAGTYSLRLMLTGAEARLDCGAVREIAIRPRPRTFTVPTLAHPQRARFDGTIELLGYEFDETQETLRLTLWWQALTAPDVDYKRFVHLYDPDTEAIPVQDDAMPRNWQYPTTLWVRGEVISETIQIDLSGLPADEYRLGIGWYDPETMDRLPAVAVSNNQRAPGDRFTLESPIRP